MSHFRDKRSDSRQVKSKGQGKSSSSALRTAGSSAKSNGPSPHSKAAFEQVSCALMRRSQLLSRSILLFKQSAMIGARPHPPDVHRKHLPRRHVLSLGVHVKSAVTCKVQRVAQLTEASAAGTFESNPAISGLASCDDSHAGPWALALSYNAYTFSNDYAGKETADAPSPTPQQAALQLQRFRVCRL
jgi:hypothetical protein